MMNRFADLLMTHRRWFALAIAVVSALAVVGVTQLTFDDRPREIIRSKDADHDALFELHADFGSDDTECGIVIESDSLFAPRTVAAWRSIIDGLDAIKEVERIRSIDSVIVFGEGGARPIIPANGAPEADFAAAALEAAQHPMVAGQLLSKDGRTMLMLVHLSSITTSVDGAAPVIEAIYEVLDAENGDFAASVTGLPALRVEIIQTIQREQVIFFAIGAALSTLVCGLLFRRLAAVAIVSIAPIVGAVWALGVLGLAGEKLNVINSVLPTLVLVIGFTDCVHLMVDVRHSRAMGLPEREASRSAVRHLGLACALTSVTTAIGFGSLAVAKIDIIQRFGVACAVGTLCTFAAVITILPLLASTKFGRRVGPTQEEQDARPPRSFSRVTEAVVGRPRLFALLGVALTTAAIIIAARLRPDVTFFESLPDESRSGAALAHVDDSFGGILFVHAQIEWPESMEAYSPELLAVINEVHAAYDSEAEIAAPISIRNLLLAMPGGEDADADSLTAQAALLRRAPPSVQSLISRFVNVEKRRTLVSGHLRDSGAAAHKVSFASMRTKLADIHNAHPDFKLRLVGTTVVAARNLTTMIGDLARSLAIAALVIFGVMAVVFRSLRLGLISVIPNVFPLVVAGAVLVAIGKPLQLTSVIVFTVCLGIAVDDTIHFISRFKRELAVDGDTKEAIRRSFRVVGQALLLTTAVLLAGFAPLMLSEIPALRNFSMLTCIALGSALLGDLVILPALLLLFVPPRSG